MSDRIVLGSGKLYVTTFTDKIPTDAELEVKENIIGKFILQAYFLWS